MTISRCLPHARLGALCGPVVVLAALIVTTERLAAQPQPQLPTLRGIEVVAVGALRAPPKSPQALALRAGVALDREAWRESAREGIEGTITVERLRSGLTQLRIAPALGGDPVLVTARLPFDTSELADFLGTPAPGLYREIAQPNRGGLCLRLQLSTDHARLELVQAEGMSAATVRFDGVELVQQPAALALAAPSSGWNYPVPVAVQAASSRIELWQGQAAVLEGPHGRALLVAVTTSNVAKPQGTARHLLDGDPYNLVAVLLLTR